MESVKTLQVFPLLLKGAQTVFEQVMIDQKSLDRSIEKLFRSNKKWGARDRRFVAETVFEMVRHYRWLQHLAEKFGFSPTRFHDLFWVHCARFYGALPVFHGDRAEENSVKDQSQFKRLLSGIAGEEAPPQIRYSFPDDLYDYGVMQFGGNEKWNRILKASSSVAEIFLRPNTLKINSPKELVETLGSEGVEAEVFQGANNDLASVRLKKRVNVFALKSFKNGLFEVQDHSSQQVARALDVQPGMRVIDACAGAGGKTLHLAAEMKNRGTLLALDTAEHKLEQCRLRARRAGVTCLDVRPITSTKVIKRLSGTADRVLLDVPCSGSGVYRRNPDSKWKTSVPRIEELVRIQSDILHRYSSLCKPGGTLIYSTCSVFPGENQIQVRNFLSQNSDFECVGEWVRSPDEGPWDGFYIAKLRRNS